MVYRIFVEKKPGLDNEARAIRNDINELLQIKGVEKVRLFNRYDVEDLAQDLFEYSVNTVFAEPQLDIVTKELPEADCIFAVEPLPGQFDQRASSAAECIQIISKGERPTVKTAKVYALYGKISEEELAAIKKYVINAVESREAAMQLPETLAVHYDIPTTVETVEGFIDLTEEQLAQFIKDRGLAMDLADIKFCQEYFKGEDRNPTITEVKMIDTYWSDHCRHTTFNTIIDNVTFEDETLQAAYDRYIEIRKGLNRTKPVTLMDIGTIAVKQLKKEGKLTK
ncbi:MAG: phosphoribosylformylglycinamidine synthase, partial [Firmicutes bacterium]|nr:phosphoribosylformylglycinamidine synthase [Bacillota bacterium]